MEKLLGGKNVMKRLAWAKENLDRDWSNLNFMDEASVSEHTAIQCSWLTLSNRSYRKKATENTGASFTPSRKSGLASSHLIDRRSLQMKFPLKMCGNISSTSFAEKECAL
ncbi:hypothetical protein Trydic_g6893 [Trypoxylus dichotomus]